MKNVKKYKTNESFHVSIAEEPMAVYGMTNAVPLIMKARLGLDRDYVTKVLDYIGRSLIDLSQVLPASYSSLTKRTTYDKETSERILEINSLYTLGIDVFGDLKTFNMWMDEPHPALEGATPFSMMDTSFGIRLIADMLGRIDYGLIG